MLDDLYQINDIRELWTQLATKNFGGDNFNDNMDNDNVVDFKRR